MPEIVLHVLKYLFLSLLFLFLARAVRAMYLEIGGPRRQGMPGRPSPRAVPRAKTKPPDRMTVTSGDGKTQTFEIEEELIIGRAEKCNVVIDDQYSSQVHARVFRKDDSVFLEDMGSTNGTTLNRRKVSAPTPVARGDKGRIGKTELEFKR